ncbi:MAG: amidohydrolase [Saprospiraceae bacterium]|nr:amidohydrolase [Saprospiraceae bacterium]
MVDISKILNQSNLLKDELISIRRRLHQYPELSFIEKNTSLFIQSELTKMNIDYTAGWANTGIVGVIQSTNPDKRIIALRADIDALPIQEDNDLEFRSAHPGIMHACGHDVHTTCLLGALKLLNANKDLWEGSIKFIFQPGEEKLPGGASMLIAENVLDNPKPDCIIGQHVQPNMPVGTLGFCENKAMASCDELYIKVIGKGGHAAMPNLANNPIIIISDLIHCVNELYKTKVSLGNKLVLSIGKINSLGGATNIIPDEVNAEGTFRCMDEGFRNEIHESLLRIAGVISDKYSASASIEIVKGYPCLINDSNLTAQFSNLAAHYAGSESVVKMDPRMTSEDFAYYSQKIPALFYRLGTGKSTNVHTSQFVVNEDSIHFGAGFMAYLAMTIDPIV